MSALARALSTGQVFWPSPSEKTDALKICFCPCTVAPGTARRFSSYANMGRFERAKLAGCCCTCANTANLYAPPSSCNEAGSHLPSVINLEVSQITSSSADISWCPLNASFTYDIYLNDVKVGTTSQNSYTFSYLISSTAYTVAVVATDGSCDSERTTTRFTTTAPTFSNLTYSLAANQNNYKWMCDLSWNTVGYYSYNIKSNNVTIFSGVLLLPLFTIPNLNSNTNYTITVQLMNGTAVLSELSVAFRTGNIAT